MSISFQILCVFNFCRKHHQVNSDLYILYGLSFLHKIFLLENSWKCHVFRNDSNFFGLEYQNESVDNTIIFPIGNMVLQTTTKVFIILNMAKKFMQSISVFHAKYMVIPPIDMFFILLINTSSAKITKNVVATLTLFVYPLQGQI